jgi:proline dehydrogenase
MSLFDRFIAGVLPLVPKGIVRKVSARYIAGDRLQDAVDCVGDLNRSGAMATLDVLGEHIERLEEATATADAYREALREIEARRLDCNVSVKLTALGLKLDKEFCLETTSRLVADAARHGNFVRIDMEDSSCTSDTLEIYRKLRAKGQANVGVVLQAYLRRTAEDVESLLDLAPNVRLCKGIYVEPRRIAFQDGAIVNRSYATLLERLLDAGAYVGIATHDEKLVFEAERLVRERKLDRARYEFQMLLGVERELRDIVMASGHRMRVYVPYGASWYAYSVRRLKENPAIAGHVMRAMFAGR